MLAQVVHGEVPVLALGTGPAVEGDPHQVVVPRPGGAAGRDLTVEQATLGRGDAVVRELVAHVGRHLRGPVGVGVGDVGLGQGGH